MESPNLLRSDGFSDVDDPSWVMDMGALTLEDCETPGVVLDRDAPFRVRSFDFLEDYSDWKVDMGALSLDDNEAKRSDEYEDMGAPSLDDNEAKRSDEYEDMGELSLDDNEANRSDEHEDKLRTLGYLQRGCRDTDITNQCVLTPILHVAQCGEEFIIGFTESSCQALSTLTPIEKLQGNQMCAEVAAACTYRLKVVDHPINKRQVVTYGTCFAVSPTVVMTADHCCWKDSVRDTYTIVRAVPAGNVIFENKKCWKATLSKFDGAMAVGDPLMRDPINDSPYGARGGVMDAAALYIDNKYGRTECKGKNLFHNVKNFLLPISPAYAIKKYGDGGSLSVGLISFPMVSEFIELLRSTEKEDAVKIFDYYKVCFEDYWKSLVAVDKEMRGLDTRMLIKHPKFNLLKRKFYENIVEVLKYTFNGFATGQMACSVGKIVGFNETSIASTYSCLSGSSGAAVISPDIKFSGVFLGVQNAPAESQATKLGKVYPDYNIATSVDNPAFVKYFMKNVISTLPLPDAFKNEDEKRLEAFQFWLWKHLKLILNSKSVLIFGDDWSTQQGVWFSSMLKQKEEQKSLYANELSDDEVSIIAQKLMEISQELLQLSCNCPASKQYRFPVSIEELEMQFNDEHHIEIFLAAISSTLRKTGLNVGRWGFRKDTLVYNVKTLQKLALHLG